jgi:hypothetical protein
MDKIDYLDGQLKALLNFVAALIKAHPAPDVLQKHFATSTASEPDSPEDLSVSDAYLDGLTEVDRRIKLLIQQAVERR